jgi:hypothetical protein
MVDDDRIDWQVMSGLVETCIASIIDAVSLSEVINLKKDHDIMQASCNNLCARIGCVAFVSIGRDSGMGDFWGQSHFWRMSEISISSCQKIPDIIVMNYMSGHFIHEMQSVE